MSSRKVSARFGPSEYGVSVIDRIKSYPLTAVLPLRANIDVSGVGTAVAYGGITGADLIESLIGSLVLVPGRSKDLRQVSNLIPSTSTISQLVAMGWASKQGQPSAFDLALNPFRLVKDSLMLYYVFGVGDLYEVLWRYLLIRLTDELRAIAGPNGVVAHYTPRQGRSVRCFIDFPQDWEINDAKNYIDNDERNSSIKTLLDELLDPKAVLKAMTHPHIARWSMEYDDPRQGYNRPSFFQPITYLSFSLRIPEALVTSIIKGAQAGTYRDPSVPLRYLRLRLPLLDILGEEVYEGLGQLGNRPYAAVVKGYCSMVLRYFHKNIDKSSNTASVRLRLSDLAHALAFALIEMGVHALSHCLMRYLAAATKVDQASMKEFVGIIYWPPPLSTGTGDDYYRGLIDGYIYRFHASPELGGAGAVAAVAGAILPRPYSHSSLKDVVSAPSLKDLIVYCGAHRSGDACYASWLGVRAVAKATLSGIKGSVRRNVVGCRGRAITLDKILEDAERLTETRFGLVNIRSPDDLVKKLYLPRERYRRVLVNKILKQIVRNILSGAGGVTKCKGRVKSAVRPYAPMLYEAAVPHCFDGCYNCVLVRNCGTRHPMTREWLVSKSMLKILLHYAAIPIP